MLPHSIVTTMLATAPAPVSTQEAGDGVSPWAVATWLFAAVMLGYFVFVAWREARRMGVEHPERTSLPRRTGAPPRPTALPRAARDARLRRPRPTWAALQQR